MEEARQLGEKYAPKDMEQGRKDIVERNDIIIEINDSEVVLNSTFQIRDMIVGEYDSTVKIKFYRNKEIKTSMIQKNFLICFKLIQLDLFS